MAHFEPRSSAVLTVSRFGDVDEFKITKKDQNGREFRVCPQCGYNMYRQDRTWTCENCGYSYTE